MTKKEELTALIKIAQIAIENLYNETKSIPDLHALIREADDNIDTARTVLDECFDDNLDAIPEPTHPRSLVS